MSHVEHSGTRSHGIRSAWGAPLGSRPERAVCEPARLRQLLPCSCGAVPAWLVPWTLRRAAAVSGEQAMVQRKMCSG